MKSLNNFSVKYSYPSSYSCFSLFIGLILFFTSCTVTHEPYSILEFTGEGSVLNYSKSGLIAAYVPDSANPAAILAGIGDLIMFDVEELYIYNDTSSHNRFLFEYDNRVVKVNDKITTISIPNNDEMIPWFENMNEKDLSALQFIEIGSKFPESYLPYLDKLAEIKPDAGFSGIDNFKDMEGLFNIFKPRYIIGAELLPGDYDMLSGLNNLEILMISLRDSVKYEPLPYMPELKQLSLTDIDEDVLTNNFLRNNKQIERVIIQNAESLDFSILKPLENLKELAVSEYDTILNLDLINEHKKLEVLLLAGDADSYDLDYDPALIRLPSLRWMTFSSNVTQEEFNSFIGTHPDLEIIQLIENDTIGNLQALSKLSKLSGLIVTTTVTDIASIKNLNNLKYLSLPGDFLDDSLNKVEIQRSLPGTRIAANEGFCLGSGWLLLLIPLLLIIRFFGRRESKSFRMR